MFGLKFPDGKELSFLLNADTTSSNYKKSIIFQLTTESTAKVNNEDINYGDNNSKIVSIPIVVVNKQVYIKLDYKLLRIMGSSLLEPELRDQSYDNFVTPFGEIAKREITKDPETTRVPGFLLFLNKNQFMQSDKFVCNTNTLFLFKLVEEK